MVEHPQQKGRSIEKYAASLERSVGPLVDYVFVPTQLEHTVLTPELKKKLEAQVRSQTPETKGVAAAKDWVAPDIVAGSVFEHEDPETGEKRIMISEPKVYNIIQAHTEREGPEQGHWSKSGKRKWMEGQHVRPMQRDPSDPEEAILGTRLMNQNPKMVAEGTMMRKCKICRANYPDKKNAKCPKCGARSHFVRFLKHDETIREGEGIFMKQLGKHVKTYKKLSPVDKAVLSAATHLKNGTAVFFSGNRNNEKNDVQASEVSTGKNSNNGQCACEAAKAVMGPSESGQSSALASGGLA